MMADAPTAPEILELEPQEAVTVRGDAVVRAWMADRGLVPAVEIGEGKFSDPAAEPDPSTWHTRTVWPIE